MNDRNTALRHARTFRLPVAAAALAAATLFAPAASSRAGGLPANWPMAPAELERRFATQDFEVLEVKGAGGGVTGASRIKVQYDDGTKLKLKWKPVPAGSADGWNNSPRKEMAVYEVQRWIADEDEFLVPTLAPHCLAFDEYRPIDPHAKASIDGSRCVLGVVAVWLENVEAPEVLWDPKRFASEPAYARSMADFNVLTYLVEHKDGRRGNILESTDPADRRVFAVDNGIAFDPFPWNFLVTNWNRLRVPWIRKDTVERLRKVDKAMIERLGVVAELEKNADGIYEVVPPGPNMDPRDGVRRRGNRIQFGLEKDELRDLGERLQSLLKKVDSGKIAVR